MKKTVIFIILLLCGLSAILVISKRSSRSTIESATYDSATPRVEEAIIIDDQFVQSAPEENASKVEPQRPTKHFGQSAPAKIVDEHVSGKGLVVTVHTPGFRAEPVEDVKGYRVHVDGQEHSNAAGTPDLPVFVKLLPGHKGLKAVLELEDASFKDYEDIEVAPIMKYELDPAQLPDVMVPVGRRLASDQIYSSDEFWPEQLYKVEEIWVRTQKFVRVEYRPIQYNPVTKTLRVYEDLVSTLKFEEAPPYVQVESATTWVPNSSCESFTHYVRQDADILPSMDSGVPANFSPHIAGASVGACLKFSVDTEGCYRITQPTLLAAGFDAAELIGNQIRLFNRDRDIPVYASNPGPGQMSSSDYIEFFGVGIDNYHTKDNVYWLGLGPGGPMMNSRSGAVAGGAIQTTHCKQQLNTDNNIFEHAWEPGLEPDHDRWFVGEVGFVFNAAFSIPSDNAVVGSTVDLETVFHYKSKTNHNVRISIGPASNIQGTVYYGTNVYVTGQVSFASSMLTSPTTSIKMKDTIALAYTFVEQLSFTYDRYLKVLNNTLGFFGETGSKTYHVGGFTDNSAFNVLDVTDPYNPIRLTGYSVVSAGGGQYEVRFGDNQATTKAYFLCEDNEVQEIATLTKVDFRDLTTTAQQADYILITDKSLRTGCYPYLTRRHQEGLSVLVAPIDDIYNEFSYGLREEGAIKQFLGYAFHHWQGPPPGYVMLVGNGSNDPLNFEGTNDDEIIPAHLGVSGFTYTALDGWYVAVNGSDLMPDIALGRMPAENVASIQNAYTKMVAYENSSPTVSWRTQMVFAVDGNEVDNINFKPSAEYFRTEILEPNGFKVFEAYVDDHGGSDINTRPFIVDPIAAEKIGWVGYVGHGSEGAWSENLFKRGTVPSLNNTVVFPVFMVFTCANGWFNVHDQMPNGDPSECLAEILLEYGGEGASAVIAPSALALHNVSTNFANGVLTAVATQAPERLGDVMMEGFISMLNHNTAWEFWFYEIFGDPAMVVNP